MHWPNTIFIFFQRTTTLWTFLVPKAAIKIIVKIARFSSFCYIWWFFRVLQHIWHSPLWNIIKYYNFFSENEEKSSNYYYCQNGHFWNQKCSQCTTVMWHFFLKSMGGLKIKLHCLQNSLFCCTNIFWHVTTTEDWRGRLLKNSKNY